MKEIELFPNPVNNYINLKIPGEIQKSIVDIFNIQGKAFTSFYLDKNQNRLDVSHLPRGIYLLRIQSDQNHIMKKFVKQ